MSGVGRAGRPGGGCLGPGGGLGDTKTSTSRETCDYGDDLTGAK